MNTKRLIESLKQSVFQTLFLCLAGLIAILAMMIPDYISKAISFFSGGMGTKLGIGSIIVTAFGIITAMIAMFQFMKKSGDDAAMVAVQSEPENTSVGIIYPIITIVLALIIYTGISFVLSFDYVAGAVRTLAPFMEGLATNSNLSDTSTKTRIIAFAIVTVPQIPVMLWGYIVGFRHRRANVHKV